MAVSDADVLTSEKYSPGGWGASSRFLVGFIGGVQPF